MSEAASATRRPTRLWVLALVVALAAAGFGYSAYRRAEAAPERVEIGGGRPLLLDFGMGACQQCKRMKPVMERASRELGDLVDARTLDIRQEESELLAERFRMTTIPLIVLVDGAGVELWRHEGFVDYPELSAVVRERLRGAGGVCASDEAGCRP